MDFPAWKRPPPNPERTRREAARAEVRHAKQHARIQRRAAVPWTLDDDCMSDTETAPPPAANDGWRWPWSSK